MHPIGALGFSPALVWQTSVCNPCFTPQNCQLGAKRLEYADRNRRFRFRGAVHPL
jgi:hypothetical protein